MPSLMSKRLTMSTKRSSGTLWVLVLLPSRASLASFLTGGWFPLSSTKLCFNLPPSLQPSSALQLERCQVVTDEVKAMAEALAQKMVEEKCKNMEENYKNMREEQDNARSSKRR